VQPSSLLTRRCVWPRLHNSMPYLAERSANTV